MVVLGMNAFIFESTVITCSVNPFSSELWMAENVPIVDGYTTYDCQYSHQTYISTIYNYLYITFIQNNLIPPFLMRSNGLIVKDIPKVHLNDPTSSDHCISFERNRLKIPLKFLGTSQIFIPNFHMFRSYSIATRYL